MSLLSNIFQSIDGRRIELVFVVTTSRVSAAAVYFQKSAQPTVLSTDSVDLEFQTNFDEDYLQTIALEACQTLCKQITSKLNSIYQISDLPADHQYIQRVSLFFDGLFLSRDVFANSQDLEAEQTISQELIDQVLEQNSGTDATTALVDRYLHSLRLNGYVVEPTQAAGQTAQQISAGGIEFTMPREALDQYLDLVQTHFNIDPSAIQTKAFKPALLRNLVRQFDPYGDYGLIMIGADSSELLTDIDRTIMTASPISYGYNDLIRQIMAAGQLDSPDKAYSLLQAHAHNHLADQSRDMIEQTQNTEANILASLITDTISAADSYLPGQVFAFVDPLAWQLLKQAFGQSPLDQSKLINLNNESITTIANLAAVLEDTDQPKSKHSDRQQWEQIPAELLLAVDVIQ